jgi:hypothetical protein
MKWQRTANSVLTVCLSQGDNRKGKLSTVGTQTGSEAGCGRQAGSERRSPKVIKTHQVEPDGTRGEILHLTWGDLFHESGREVSRGHSVR